MMITRKLLRHLSVPNTVRRTLVLHSAVVDNLRKKYQLLKTRNAKMRFKNMLIGKYVRIYKMQTFCRETFGFSVRTRNLATGQKVATECGAYVFHVRI